MVFLWVFVRFRGWGAYPASDEGRELKMSGRWPQARPKRAQDGSQRAPRWPQDGPKMAQAGPKVVQEGPRWFEDGPRWSQDGPKMAPR